MKKSLLLLNIFLLFFDLNPYAQCTIPYTISFTVSSSIGCDSTEALITNTSTIPLKEIAKFTWHFGDGQVITGDSVTNTDFWHGPVGDFKIRHLYTNNGIYDIKLIVEDTNHCTASYWLKSAAVNIVLSKEIIHSYGNLEADFSYNPIGGISQWEWNFGDPASGPANYNSEDFEVNHKYSPGIYMISLNVVAGPCDITLLDTVQILGPAAIIEIPFVRVAEQEKYQCVSRDTVHFTNNSIFYRNDADTTDEDSMLLVNGKSLFAFNYDISTGNGNQSSLASAMHLYNRTMGPQVVRLWDFDDPYAPQCTTSTAKGKNTLMNCNWSEDEFPRHKYMDWDSVYTRYFYSANDSFYMFSFDTSINNCIVSHVDTSEADLHYTIFLTNIPRPYKATLSLYDTLTGRYAQDEVIISIGKPNADRMTRTGGELCAFDGNDLNYYLEFDLNTGSQSYFAVNYDSFTDPGAYVPFNSGGVLALPKPGSPIPFVIPYPFAGSYPDQFIKTYTPEEIGDPLLRSPAGSFTLGLIVGNGIDQNGNPECLDTAWYHDMFSIMPLDADFEVYGTQGESGGLCKGDPAYFKIKNESQTKVSVLRWVWGTLNYGNSPTELAYVEQFRYMEPYTGPSPGRNDSAVAFNNQEWYYNYVVRSTIDVALGHQVIDTIVTSIIKDWKTMLEDGQYEYIFGDSKHYYSSIPKGNYHKLLGTCIDTTGLSGLFTIVREEYRDYNNDQTYMVGDRRYRYTNPSHTDSIEVAHVLHFRDSSLRGYDTLIRDTDTIFGVYKHTFLHNEITLNGDTLSSYATGPLLPGLRLTNINGCESGSNQALQLGLFSDFKIHDRNGICVNSEIEIHDSIRYWNLYSSPKTLPLDSGDFWNDSGRIGKETFEVDWDENDGTWDAEHSFKPAHTYTSPGIYTITIAILDSTGCTDTIKMPVKVGGVSAKFGYNNKSTGCNYNFEFYDSSIALGPDDLLVNSWDFGDGTTLAADSSPVHIYAEAGTYQVKLTSYSLLCTDSTTVTIEIPDNSQVQTPQFSYSVNGLSLSTTNSGSKSHTYFWEWGDSTQGDTAYNSSHVYTSDQIYMVCLTAIENGSNCKGDTCMDIAIGSCNALFGFSKDSSQSFTILLHDSSTGNNLSYIWYWGDGDSSLGAQAEHDYEQSGKYRITLQVSNLNCISRYSDSLGMDTSGNLLKKDGFRVITGVLEPDQNYRNIQIYPNPTNAQLHITGLGALKPGNKMELISMQGEVLLIRDALDTILDLSEFPSGIYILYITTEQGVYSLKVIKS